MFDFPTVKRKKPKEKAENYYKILGTTAKAGQAKIKLQYIAKVKEFPPETCPDEFQKIREAYETLKDPVKRREYDIMRKFGPKIEKQMERAMFNLMLGDYVEAHGIIDEVINIDPQNYQYYTIKAQIFLVEDDIKSFSECYDKAIEYAPAEMLEDLWAIKIKMLTYQDYLEEAIEELEKAILQFPTIRMQKMYIPIYKSLNDYEKLWKFIAPLIPQPNECTFDDFDNMMTWLVTAVELNKTSEQQRILTRIRKLIHLSEDRADIEWAIDCIMDEYNEYKEVGRFSDALVFVELAKSIDKKNVELQKEEEEIKPLAVLDNNISRLRSDEQIFSYVYISAVKLFYEEYTESTPEGLEEVYLKIKSEMKDIRDVNEYIAMSINRIKKKYSILYKAFKEDWDEMLNSHTSNMNREERRRLK